MFSCNYTLKVTSELPNGSGKKSSTTTTFGREGTTPWQSSVPLTDLLGPFSTPYCVELPVICSFVFTSKIKLWDISLSISTPISSMLVGPGSLVYCETHPPPPPPKKEKMYVELKLGIHPNYPAKTPSIRLLFYCGIKKATLNTIETTRK